MIMTMRELVIQRLTSYIEDCEGIPRYFDCDDEYITDPQEIQDMTDEDLLELLENAAGFQG